MKLTAENVRKVATLARLDIPAGELDVFTEQLGKIVAFVEMLSEVDTQGVEQMAHPLDVHNVVRADELRPGLVRESALANAPQHDEECFLVPAVMARKG